MLAVMGSVLPYQRVGPDIEVRLVDFGRPALELLGGVVYAWGPALLVTLVSVGVVMTRDRRWATALLGAGVTLLLVGFGTLLLVVGGDLPAGSGPSIGLILILFGHAAAALGGIVATAAGSGPGRPEQVTDPIVESSAEPPRIQTNRP